MSCIFGFYEAFNKTIQLFNYFFMVFVFLMLSLFLGDAIPPLFFIQGGDFYFFIK